MSVNSDLETAVKAGFESGYEKGVRDMFEAVKEICHRSNSFGCSMRENNIPCNGNNCPIAQKLLKAVK